MKTFLGTLPVVLLLCVDCTAYMSGPDELFGSGGSAVGTAGSATAGGGAGGGVTGVAGSATGVAGRATGAAGSATGVAGSAAGESSNGASGSGAGGTPGTSGAPGQGGAGAAGVPTDGKGLYDLNCGSCHGDEGVGTTKAPEIRHPVREYANWVVRNGRAVTTFAKPMEKWSTDDLSDAQLTLIWDYLDLSPQPTTGQALFIDYCANCHGADGKGGPVTRPLAGEGKNVLKLVRSGKGVGQYAMRHDSMPAFSTARISDPELNMILDHVNTF